VYRVRGRILAPLLTLVGEPLVEAGLYGLGDLVKLPPSVMRSDDESGIKGVGGWGGTKGRGRKEVARMIVKEVTHVILAFFLAHFSSLKPLSSPFIVKLHLWHPVLVRPHQVQA
jgi:hypothetical protein